MLDEANVRTQKALAFISAALNCVTTYEQQILLDAARTETWSLACMNHMSHAKVIQSALASVDKVAA